MNSKTSLFNKGLFKNNIKRFYLGSILFFVMIVFFLPMYVILAHQRGYAKNGILETTYVVIYLMGIVVPAVVSFMINRDIHESKQNSFIHSLPLSKKSIYFTDLFSALVLMFVPIIINGLILLIISFLPEYSGYFSANEVIIYTLMQLSLIFIMYSMAMLSSYISGTSGAQVFLYFTINLLPIATIYLVYYFLNTSLFGFGNYDDFVESLVKLFPAIKMYDMFFLPSVSILYYIVLAAAVYLITYFIYKSRKAETTGDILSFKTIKPIFKYCLTSIAMLTSYVSIKVSYGLTSAIVWMIIIGYGVYLVIEMLFRRKVKLFLGLKGFVVTVLVVSAFITCINTDAFGYSNYIPDINSISYATFTDKDAPKIENKESIKNLINIHKDMIAQEGIENTDGMIRNFDVIYHLNNGKTVKRNYSVYMTDNIMKKLDELFKDDAVKYNYFEALRKDTYLINEILIEKDSGIVNTTDGNEEYKNIITDKKKIKEIYDCYVKDALSLKYSQLIDDRFDNSYCYMWFYQKKENTIQSQSFYLIVNNNYKNTIEAINKYIK